MSTGPDRYLLNTIVIRGIVTADKARADWGRWDPDLREGNLEDGFTLYARSQFGHRFAPINYKPLPGAE